MTEKVIDVSDSTVPGGTPSARTWARPLACPMRCRRAGRAGRFRRGTPAKAKGPSFAELGLRPEVLHAIEEMGFTEPMQVQAKTLPPIMEGRDLMVQSRTGSGNTSRSASRSANT